VANCPIEVLYPQSGAVAKIVLGNDWRVQVSEELLQALSRSFDAAKVSLNYQ
jgi:hypothetical protein